ncbi:MAG: hypothetical protein ACI87E_005247 [Mariniblastus sp.]|jgi:hypothetical protein
MKTSCLFLGAILGCCFISLARGEDPLPFQHKVDVYRNAEGDAIAFTVRLEQPFLAEEFEKSNFLRLRSDSDQAYLIYPQQTKFKQKHAEFFGRLRGKGVVKLRLSYDTVLENLDGSRRVEAKEGIIEVQVPELEEGAEKKAIGSAQVFKDWANQQNLHFARMLRYYPDETFFQYCLLQSQARYGVKPPPIPQRMRSDEETETELYEVFTGSLAIQQTLQREILTGKRGISDYNVAIETLQPPRLQSLDYEALLKQKREDKIEPSVHEIAGLVPRDQYLLHFNSLTALDQAIDLGNEWGDSVLRLFTVQAQDNRVKEKFEQQFVIDHVALEKLFAEGLATEIALTGSDPTILEGTDLSVIINTTDSEKFIEQSLKWIAAAKAKNDEIVVREFNYRGHQVRAHYTNDRNVSSFLVQHKNYVVYSNSHRAIRRIVDAVSNTEPSLKEEPDYRYMTTILPPATDQRCGYFYASDKFLRKMVGAEAKISQKRRMQCFNNLIMHNNASLFFRLENGRSPKSLSELAEGGYVDTKKIICPHGGAYTYDAASDTCTCSLHNRLKYLTPNAELSVRSVSKTEASEYSRYRKRYEKFWQKVFDPIAVRITVDSTVKLETCILPMANSGIYDDLRASVQKNPRPIETSRIAPSAIVSYVMVPGREKTAEFLKMIPGVNEVVTDDPTLTDLSWIGDRVSVHLCDGDGILEIDPTRMKALDIPFIGTADTEVQGMVAAVFMMATLPVYATVDVENVEKAESLLKQFAERIFLYEGDLGGFTTKLDAYQLPDYQKHEIYVLNIGVYALSLRLHVAMVGDQLVIATEPHVLREVIDVSQAKPNEDAPTAHMLFRLNHQALDRLSDDVQLYWAEKSRVSCHRNVISIYNFHKLYGVPIDQIPALSEAKYGVRYFCPDHGEYTFNKELNQVVCSVHGNREHSHQHSHMEESSSFSQFVDSLDTITASLKFQDDALMTTIEIKRNMDKK